MNTNNLKKFAQDARRKLFTQVGARLEFVLTTDSAQLREKTDQIKRLREELNRTPREQLIEKVAYIWFNRLMALRFMDANDYQPLGIRIITPKEGYTIPELLEEAKRGNIPDELPVKKQRIYDLLDNGLPSTNPQNEAYKELLIGACNHLHSILPFLFEKINDYTELLLPDDLTSEFSIVVDILKGMLVEDCKEVEIIGWLYQFYISEEKDRLINAKKRYQPHEIIPVTQLFTPKWIVKYMVDNTLGQFWQEARPKSTITEQLEFYIKPHHENIIPKRNVKSPEDITFLDPCVGSGHILCYAFDIFYRIYQEEGYNEADIPGFIISKNLFGLDIDDRAVQLAGFALMMKGRHYDRRFFKRGITPNIIAFQNSQLHPKFINAKTHGSLIKITESEVTKIQIDQNSIFAESQSQLKKQALYLARSYDILVTNPPYVNSTYMDGELKQFIEKEYKSTKSDLFACFTMQALHLTKTNGFIGFISPFVWMFISSYEDLRTEIIRNTTFDSLVQLEYNAFEPACVPVATFVLRNNYIDSFKGSYIKLSEFKGHENQAPKALEAINNHNCGWFYIVNQKDFEKIPGNPIGYWVSDKMIEAFNNGISLSQFGEPRVGLDTGDNQRFIRYYYEVEFSKIGFSKESIHSFNSDLFDYVPHTKGGDYRKWYGNLELVLKFNKKNYLILSESGNHLPSKQYYFKEGVNWSRISNSKLGLRYTPKGFVFNSACPTIFTNHSNLLYLMGFLISPISESLLSALSPTMNFQAGEIRKLPIIIDKSKCQIIINLIDENIEISRNDWNANETSWDFKKNELIRIKGQEDIDFKENYIHFKKYWETQFLQLHKYEEELNHHFIDIYGMGDELDPHVQLEDITILQELLVRKSLVELNKQLIRDTKTLTVLNYDYISLPFIVKEVIAQFISYAVGCMFGRYSLDKEGLILANQGETLKDYLQKVSNSKNEVTFLPDEDNIIPILEDEWFEDDIVNRFYKFLKVTFGEQNFNKNLNFLEEQIGSDIRKYFIKDYYPDHIRRYKKRPIYWMFSSPNGSFNVLIYLHRYTPDTISNILNKYLREFVGKLKTRREHLNHLVEIGSSSEKTKAIKEMDSIDKMVIELRDYERDVLYPLATERIAIDLDDGVLVNYNKFGKAVKEVAGLNDKQTKEKVKKFDWIDTNQIR